ncbi:potassium-transporting ATPase subunit F [Telmatobacter bradus]|uniref:potassium-transporting ATPase subunit F n=1 Tax=Telmatobacter bradus TaxID=474953 RepID=UPI003B42AE18
MSRIGRRIADSTPQAKPAKITLPYRFLRRAEIPFAPYTCLSRTITHTGTLKIFSVRPARNQRKQGGVACIPRAGACLRQNGETGDARRSHAAVHGCIFRSGVFLRQGLPEAEVDMDVISLVAIVLSVLLLGYLTLTLLFPEKF